MFTYRSLFKKAWNLVWDYKHLWFFGLFASLLIGGGAWEYQMLTESLNQSFLDTSTISFAGPVSMGVFLQTLFLSFIDLFNYDFLTIINALSIILITFIFLAIIIWLAAVSQAALISNVKKINDSKKEVECGIRNSLSDAQFFFWPVLLINFIARVTISALLFIAGFPLLLISLKDSGLMAITYLILFIVFIPVSLGLSLIAKYAIAYKVLDHKSSVSAIECGFRLFTKNWLISLEMVISLFIIGFLCSGLTFIVLLIILLPWIVLGVLFKIYWLIISLIIIAVIVVAVIGAALTTFQTAAWTNLFLRLKDKGVLSKLERIFGNSRR